METNEAEKIYSTLIKHSPLACGPPRLQVALLTTAKPSNKRELFSDFEIKLSQPADYCALIPCSENRCSYSLTPHYLLHKVVLQLVLTRSSLEVCSWPHK